MTRDFSPTDERFCGSATAAGYTADGREVVVYRRMYNAIITIGPAGSDAFDQHW